MTTHAQPQGKNPPKLISFDCNGDMTVLIEGKPTKLSITVGQVERMQALLDSQSKATQDDEGALVRIVRNDYQALAVVLNPDPDSLAFAEDDLPAKIPVNHARQIVKNWFQFMLYNPGMPKDPQ